MPKEQPKKREKYDFHKQYDVLTLHVGRAGIGRMGFKAWFDHEYRDASDGDDEGTYESPREAVEARLDELEKDITLKGWDLFFTKL